MKVRILAHLTQLRRERDEASARAEYQYESAVTLAEERIRLRDQLAKARADVENWKKLATASINAARAKESE